jgi:hypothetical protein
MVDKLVKQFSRRYKVFDNVVVLCFVSSKVGVENLLKGLVAVVQSRVGLKKSNVVMVLSLSVADKLLAQ